MRTICVFTGSRAEYGLLRPLMEEIRKDKGLRLQVIASGMHLSPEFGLTYQEIEKDGFRISEKVEMLMSSDTVVGISKSIGLGVIGCSEALLKLKPDVVVILGDRFEALSCAIASTVSRIPIAHIHGGELTEGAYDDAFRHSITKMSRLHFTSTEDYRKRVIQLGEHPSSVFNVGALGIDNIKRLKLLSKEALEKKLGLKFNKYNLLVTFHPATLENNSSRRQFQNLLDALDSRRGTMIIFTKANADTDGRVINIMIDEYVTKNPDKSAAFTSMGQTLYLSTMKHVDAVVGNSSSGIIEAPSLKIGTINIGDRQKGRIRAKSVIDCEPARESIVRSFNKLYSAGFQAALSKSENPYGKGRAASNIKAVLKGEHKIGGKLKKSFYDIR